MSLKSLCSRKCFGSPTKIWCTSLSTKPVASPELDEAVRNDIKAEKLKPRKHPGVMKLPPFTLPDTIIKAITTISEDHPVKNILEDAKQLTQFLFTRHYPLEDEDIEEKQEKFKDQVIERYGFVPDNATEELIHHHRNLVNSAVRQLMYKYCYKWSPLDMQEYSSLVYLFTRAAPNYAATVRVFHEIAKVCPDYRPTRLFDFGSGVGSVSWAAKHFWGDSLKEFVNIDSSGSMNELAEAISCGGKRTEKPPNGLYYRQFLPAQNVPFNLVVCAHSLLEMPSRDSRLKLLLNLWNKTTDFLVIIEQGTKPGFKLVDEARAFILSLNREDSPLHIFAPCPHDDTCPRSLRGPYPCHIQVKYCELNLGRNQSLKKELLSYVIIRKDKRPTDTTFWPRVVRPVLKRHDHVICRLCTEQGQLQELIFTPKKHGKMLYKCAKVTNWGDRLPIRLLQQDSSKQQQDSSDQHQQQQDCSNQHQQQQDSSNQHQQQQDSSNQHQQQSSNQHQQQQDSSDHRMSSQGSCEAKTEFS